MSVESSVSLQGSGVSAGPFRVTQLGREMVNECFVTVEQLSSSCTVSSSSFFFVSFLLVAHNDPRLHDDRLCI